MRPADKLQLKAATILPLLDSPDPSKTQSTVGTIALYISYISYIYHMAVMCSPEAKVPLILGTCVHLTSRYRVSMYIVNRITQILLDNIDCNGQFKQCACNGNSTSVTLA